MTHYLLPVENEDAFSGDFGLKRVLDNKNKWVNLGDAEGEVNTYDKGTTILVYNNKAYQIYKDYVFITEKVRVYIGIDFNLSTDQLN